MIKELKVGNYLDKEVIIGKLLNTKLLPIIDKFINENDKDIIFGGEIDYSKSIVYPTIIKRKINLKQASFLEFFSPIFLTYTYSNEKEVLEYLNSKLFQENAMYISIFGNFQYEKKLKKHIIVKEQSILDVDNGNEEFGGYSSKASFLKIGNSYFSHPILITREINRYHKNYNI